MYDLVIIGSGPAGLSAAVYAMRARLDAVVIEKEAFSGGQIINTERVDNYLGMYGISGYDIANAFKGHADSVGAAFITGTVTSVSNEEKHKIITLSNGKTIETKSIIVATGARHKRLGAEGEDRFKGMGVSYCATCDGAFYKGKKVMCVGGGNTALQEALYLSNICDTVYLVHRRDGLRASKSLQEKVFAKENIIFMPFYEVVRLNGDTALADVLIKNNQTGEERLIEVSGVFAAVGMEPETDFIKGIVDLDKSGHIVAGEDCITSCEGIFAAGDVRTKNVRQIITAVADGACAVHAAEEYVK